jgi:hypothetical protein
MFAYCPSLLCYSSLKGHVLLSIFRNVIRQHIVIRSSAACPSEILQAYEWWGTFKRLGVRFNTVQSATFT